MPVIKISLSGTYHAFSKINCFKFHKRSYNTHIMKVTICGAAGGVGKPLSLILKQSPHIDELAIYDIKDTTSIGHELNHIDTKCKVSTFSGQESISDAFRNAKIVIVTAAFKNSSFLPYNTMLDANGKIIKDIIQNFACHCPKALLALATNPINSLVPLAVQVLISYGVFNPTTVFGVTTLNVVRANRFVAEIQNFEPECVFVPVIGGHADKSIVPLFSRTKPRFDFTDEEIETLTNKIQNAHHDIIKVKQKKSATLSCAFSIARFVISLVKGIQSKTNIVECTFVKTGTKCACNYLSLPVLLGPSGVQKIIGLPKLSEYENCIFNNAVRLLQEDIAHGEDLFRRLPD